MAQKKQTNTTETNASNADKDVKSRKITSSQSAADDNEQRKSNSPKASKPKTQKAEGPKPKGPSKETNEIKKVQKRIVSQNEEAVPKDRSKQRRRESENYQSVIIKRTDETFRHADDVLEMAIHEGREQIERPALSLFMSSVAGGLIIGFTVLCVGVMASVLGSMEGVNRVLIATLYPLGFVLCILSRTQLFTEHTATAIYPLLDKTASLKAVLKLWGIVIIGNLCGGFVIAGLLAMADPIIHAKSGYILIAEHVIDYQFHELFVSAILAGWLMALGAWTILSTHSTTSQIMCIYAATFIIGVGGLHHSIAGSVELFVGVFMSSEITMISIIPFIAVILAGNAVGGSVFVALLNHGHIRGLN